MMLQINLNGTKYVLLDRMCIVEQNMSR